jgi:hypothetical protein
MTNTL